jgi:hypothetical protein
MDKLIHAYSLPHGKETWQVFLPSGTLPKGNSVQELVMPDKFEHRRQRLIELLEEKFQRRRGAQAEAARVIGCSDNYLSRLLTEQTKHRKNIAEDFKEKIEEAFKLEKGWLDKPLGYPVTHAPMETWPPTYPPRIAKVYQVMDERTEMLSELDIMLPALSNKNLKILYEMATVMYQNAPIQTAAG